MFPGFFQLRFGHPCDEAKRFDITQYVRQQLGPFYPKTSVWGDPCPGVEKILVILILPFGAKKKPVTASLILLFRRKKIVPNLRKKKVNENLFSPNSQF